MVAAVSSKGKVLQFVAESTFNTDPAAGYSDIRVEGEPTVASPAETVVPVNTLTSNPYDGEPPVTTSQFVEDAISLTTIIRATATPGGDSFTVAAAKTGGYQVASSDDTSTASSTTTAITLTDATNVLTGEGCHVFLPVIGKYIPVLSADTTAGVLTVGMELPEAPTNLDPILGADVVSPGAPGPVANTISMRHWNQTVNSGGSNFTYHLATGCAMTSVGDIVVERGALPTWEMNFTAAQLTRGANASFPTNSFTDDTGIQVWDDTLCGFADAAAAGGIAEAYQSVIKATLTPGVEATVIPEAAGSADQGGVCSYMSAPTDTMPRLVLEIKADEGFLDDWEKITGAVRGQLKYISVLQYGTADSPGMGIFCPSARLIEQPVFEPYGNSFEKMTLTYQLYPAGYTAGAASIQGNQPYYLVLPSDRA